MTDSARRVYLAMGRGFLFVGVAIAAFAIADTVFALDYFSGSPLGTAVFLALIGAALLWTVRQADGQRAEADVADAARSDDPEASEAPTEGPEDHRA